MLNKYLDLLQHATEAMTSVGKTGAGAAEYFQAVGYEFLVINLWRKTHRLACGMKAPFPTFFLH